MSSPVPVNDSSFPTNSQVSKTPKEKKPEKERPEKVISGEAVQRKKGLGRKIAETFTGDDARTVGEFVIFDVIVPASKAMISDAVSQGIERMLFGDVRRRPNGGPRVGTPSHHTAYTAFSRPTSSSPGRAFEPDGPRRSMTRRARATHDFDEIVLPSRGEAELVLDKLSDILAAYDVVTVSDLYDLVGITGSFTDDKWGWFNLRDASFTRVRDGYLLDLPKTEPID